MPMTNNPGQPTMPPVSDAPGFNMPMVPGRSRTNGMYNSEAEWLGAIQHLSNQLNSAQMSGINPIQMAAIQNNLASLETGYRLWQQEEQKQRAIAAAKYSMRMGHSSVGANGGRGGQPAPGFEEMMRLIMLGAYGDSSGLGGSMSSSGGY